MEMETKFGVLRVRININQLWLYGSKVPPPRDVQIVLCMSAQRIFIMLYIESSSFDYSIQSREEFLLKTSVFKRLPPV